MIITERIFMIRCNNISKEFERQIPKEKKKNGFLLFGKKGKTKENFYAIQNIGFEAKDGEILGILGPNGAGKTTLLRILSNVMTASGGEVEISTKENLIAQDSQTARRNIGYLSANTKLFKHITPRELMQMVGKLYGFEEAQINERSEEIIKLLDMSAFADNKIDKLSTGQMQRSNIARCLMHDPLNYIFDEPTLGLDVIASRAIIEFMKNERNRGKAILYSTHYMEEAEYLCDKILMIHQGKIIAYGTPDEIKALSNTSNLRDAFIVLSEKTEEA